ncbi:MAG TPA: radical SAM protein [Leptospiraceae bacterium]|nr:radical SAM protein [Leptospiraceae bacterium]HNF25386.1 radical SAM protein [Leptospiraceae bacterium]HNI96983.1 radical SAM protein [Leptospiraceae bacterium]HNM01486.1 radical SAM protein [Leptospiraceae bacterium]
MPERPYIYYDFTLSLCPVCLKRIDAKIVMQDSGVYMMKTCSEHGSFKVLIEEDEVYYRNIRNYAKRSEMPLHFGTEVIHRCPMDCGLCSDHEQHSCLTVLEITDRCNLECPTCYSASSPRAGRHRTLSEIEFMLDRIVYNEGRPDVVQISGGEPTVHPDFFEVMRIAKSKPIRHIMLNTNGIKIANDPDFAKRLSEFAPGFEIYLQFDSFQESALKKLRGKDLRSVREKAIQTLNELNLSTTLVVTLEKGINDSEIGEIIQFALNQKCIRGITFQPTQQAGRTENFLESGRLTLSGVRREIISQSGIFTEKDLIPVPCNPDALAMAYALKLDEKVFPLTRFISPGDLLENSRNTIVFEHDERMKNHLLRIFSTGNSVESLEEDFHSLMCCLPTVSAPGLKYENLFRIIIMKFMDAYDFDVRAVKKSCVHMAVPDGRMIPFETMNLFYRQALLKTDMLKSGI